MTLQEIYAFAPTEIRTLRTERYSGGAASLGLASFSLDETAVIQALYDELKSLSRVLDPSGEENPVLRSQATEVVHKLSLSGLQEQLVDLLNETRDEAKARAFFDIASGPLSSLIGYVLLIRLHGMEPGYRQTMYYLVRDQLKIMRALVQDLDPTGRARDEADRCHSIDLLLEKWRQASYRAFERIIEVRFTNFFEGFVAERCLEFAEIDNLFYQFANNCVKFSADSEMDIHVAALPNKKHLRWIFSNRITEAHAEALANLREDGKSIFEREVSTTGKGYGLGILAESVANAYGYEDTLEAEEEGLFGFKVDAQRTFHLWFHWPTVREELLAEES
jgi:hypothetical protein